MLQAYKDTHLAYAISASNPLTFVLPQAGQKKDLNFYVLPTESYPPEAVFQILPAGVVLQSFNPPVTLTVKTAAASWSTALPNVPTFQLYTGITTMGFSIRVTALPVEEPTIFTQILVRVLVLLNGALLDSLDIPLAVVLQDQALASRFRLLDSNRQLLPSLPGFTWGSFRWRSEQQINASALLPTNWNQDPMAIGAEKFQAGVGYADDLAFNVLSRADHSVYPSIQRGEYFTGSERYYLPSDTAHLEIFPANGYGPLVFPLSAAPVPQKPVFVGNYQADSTGYFDRVSAYRYLGDGLPTTSDGWDSVSGIIPNASFTEDLANWTKTGDYFDAATADSQLTITPSVEFAFPHGTTQTTIIENNLLFGCKAGDVYYFSASVGGETLQVPSLVTVSAMIQVLLQKTNGTTVPICTFSLTSWDGERRTLQGSFTIPTGLGSLAGMQIAAVVELFNGESYDVVFGSSALFHVQFADFTISPVTQYQFQLDRTVPAVTLNRPLPAEDLFLGFVPSVSQITFDIPIFPIWGVLSAYIETPDNTCTITNFDQENGQITLIFPSGNTGSKVYLAYVPAVAVLYEAAGQTTDRSVLTDLNPAFAGIGSGYLYLMHRRQRAEQIVLSADKPRIAIPASLQNVINLIAYGPVYYQNDFALLLATAYGATTAQPIPGARLKIIPAIDFQGYINYVDPTAQTVEVVTGGDGTAPFIYTPNQGYGFYLDSATAVSSDGLTFTLPEPISLSQLWSSQDGWYLLTYSVQDDDPVLGKVGANVGAGEVPWQTHGQPGTPNYRTNGYRALWTANSNASIYPVQLTDASGAVAFLSNGTLNPAFDGNAVSITYADAIPTGTNIGAYFIGFIGRVSFQVQDVTTGLISNSLMLQLEPTPQILDKALTAGYLYLNSATTAKQGRLNANRLGGAPIPIPSIFTS